MAKSNPTLCLQREDSKVFDEQSDMTISVAVTLFSLYLLYHISHEESSTLIFTDVEQFIP